MLPCSSRRRTAESGPKDDTQRLSASAAVRTEKERTLSTPEAKGKKMADRFATFEKNLIDLRDACDFAAQKVAAQKRRVEDLVKDRAEPEDPKMETLAAERRVEDEQHSLGALEDRRTASELDAPEQGFQAREAESHEDGERRVQRRSAESAREDRGVFNSRAPKANDGDDTWTRTIRGRRFDSFGWTIRGRVVDEDDSIRLDGGFEDDVDEDDSSEFCAPSPRMSSQMEP